MRLLPWKRGTYTHAERERILDQAARDQLVEYWRAVRLLMAQDHRWGLAAPDHRDPRRGGS